MENIRWMIPSYSQAGAPKHRFFFWLFIDQQMLGLMIRKQYAWFRNPAHHFFIGSLSHYFPQMFSTSAGGSVGSLNHQQSFNPQAAPDLAIKIMRCPYTLPTGPSSLFHHIEFHQTIILPKTNSSSLKVDGWNTIVSFWDGLFSGAMSVLGSALSSIFFSECRLLSLVLMVQTAS